MFFVTVGSSQELYEEMLRAMCSRCDELHCGVDLTKVIVDFEQAIINANNAVLGQQVTVQGCFYHLTQSTWRHIQALGMVPFYNSNDEVKGFCCMIDALSFLPVTDVPNSMAYLRSNVPDCKVTDDLEELLNYFDKTYVSETHRIIQRPNHDDASIPILRIRRSPPLFPPGSWNVHVATLRGDPEQTILVKPGIIHSARWLGTVIRQYLQL